MKKSLLALFIMALICLLAACGNDNASDKDTIEDKGPQNGGSITIGLSGDPSAFNPLYTADQTSLIIQQAIYAPLFYTNNGEVTPALAESLTPSEDNLTYTLKLKENLKWHDNEALTADDIIFTVQSILDESQNVWTRGSFIFNDQAVEMTKVDETTVEFTLPIVAPALEVAIQTLYPIPQHVFENEGDLQLSVKNDAPVGSGSFKFVEYKSGQYVKLEKFDDFFGGKPYLDNIIFQILKDDNAGNLALQNGEVNMKPIKPADVESIENAGSAEVITYPENRMTYISFNMNVPELQNVKFRQALSYTLNREDMIKAAYGTTDFAEPASSIFTPDVKYQTTDVETYDQDIKKAKQLLKESGVDTSRDFHIIYVNNNKAYEGMGLYLQQQFKEIGVNLVLDSGDASATYTIADDRTSKAYDLYLDGYIMRSEPDAYKMLYKGDALYNYSNYHNDHVDSLWETAAVTANGPEREALYTEIQQTIASDAVAYPVSYDNNIFALDKRYGGVKEATPTQITLLRDFSKLYLK